MAKALLDSLGWTYIGLIIAWTVALLSGMLFLHHHRNLPSLQIRRLPLFFAGVISLHLYGAACLSAYVIGPIFPCTAEFWIMSIYLPFGFAMFHAANSQFLHIASRQKQFARMSALSDTKTIDEKEAERLANSRLRRIIRGVERADKIDRMMLWIGIGLAAQLALTLLVFFGSKKFHPSFGIFDYTVKGTGAEVRMQCSKGWEWWLSIVWQFFWAWIYAPYMLWKSRGIRDVHGWRVQTVCCCLAGIPASPLWLAGLYVPEMATVNAYFPPPMWFSASIFLMEIFTIAFPIIQVLKSRNLRQETLNALSDWEKQQNYVKTSGIVGEEKSSTYTGTTYATDGQASPTKSTFEPQSSDAFNMTALEYTLRINPEALLQFAALKDFSGENVSFLTHVAEWKRAWFVPQRSTEEHRHQQFIAAVRIYAYFVSLEYAEFPINICSREMKRLHQIFSGPAALLMRRPSSCSSDTISPFNECFLTEESTTSANLETLGRANLKSATMTREVELERGYALAKIQIPESFFAEIFEEAEQEIKYLVFTNTWPKFVGARYASSNDEIKEDACAHRWAKATLCNV